MKTCLILHNMGVQDRIMDNDVYATYNPAFNQEIASEKEKRMYSMTYVPTVSTTRAYKLN